MKQLLQSIELGQRYLRGMGLAILAAIAVFAIATPASATGVYDMPFLSPGDPTWVIDDGNAISRINESQLSKAFDKLRQDTETEVRAVTIRHLDYGETIESFTNALFEKWFPTPEAQANQVLLALDVVTNNAAIRVGEAAAETLNPEIAESVAQETLLYPLIEGDKYNEAFLDAKDRLVAVLSGEPDPGAPDLNNTVRVEGTFATAEETEAQKSNSTTVVVVLLIAATVIPMVTYFVLYQ
ncbi:photosystem II repair protein Psb32 [Baaleninema simplex]|uniref:photosystem II repair protein Psb32 n=1 Tax=Baaleninema simplex TaxID=2862350 RepID=UPI000344FE26|nr:TPM domain-containing protein [Baaleninema simplex]